MSKPRLLDLYAGAGGAAMGYARAGFEVVGVDIEPQPNYCGDEFWQDDALAVLTQVIELGIGGLDAIHASPPCQAFTAYKRTGNVGEHPDLIAQTRDLLEETGLPYVIENVPGAPLRNPVQLCGSAFGLDVRRHRLFETNFSLMAPGCVHGQQAGEYPQATNRENPRKTVEVGVWRIPLEEQKRAMGVDWDVTLEELSEAIPPAFTQHISYYLLAEIEARQKAAA